MRLTSPFNRSSYRSSHRSSTCSTSRSLLASLSLSSLSLLSVCWVVVGAVGEVNANPTLEITSPTTGSCVPNSSIAQLAGDPSEPFVVEPSEVTFSMTVSDPLGDPLSVSATLNGAPVALNTDTLILSAPNTPEEFSFVHIPGELINDGPNQVVTFTITSPSGSASDSVTFDLDRTPPAISFTQADLALQELCDPNVAALLSAVTPNVSDARDPAPTLTTSLDESACSVSRVFVAKDNCGEGNSLEVALTARTPAPSPAQIEFVEVEDQGAYLEATPYFGVTSNEACFDLTAEVLTPGADEPIGSANGGPFNEPGDYTLTATASDCSGVSATSTIDFSVIEPPRANAGGPYVVTQGQGVLLDASQSFCPPELGGCVEHAWDFDLDNGQDLGYAFLGESVLFNTYDPQANLDIDDGVYRVGVRVMTEQGQVEFAEAEVTVLDALPTCDAGGPYEVRQGEGVLVDASGSVAGVPSEPIIAYRWLCNDSGAIGSEAYGPYAVTHTCVFYEEGEHEVELAVEDLDLSSCVATATVTVTDIEPIAGPISILTPPPYLEGQEVTLSAGATSSGSAVEPLTSFSWSWGDGTPNTLNEEGFELRRPTHTFNESGAFEVCLTVSDGDSDASDCTSIEVLDISPRARFSGDLFAVEGELAYFSFAGTRSGGAADPLTRVEIDWGDGVTEELNDLTSTDLTHRFQTDGQLTITLRAYDEDSFDEVFWELYVDDVSPDVVITHLNGPAEEGVSARWSAASSSPGAPSDPISWYVWDFGDGTILEGPDLVEVEHTWADDGEYTLSLTLGDSDEQIASREERFVVVANRAPFNGAIIAEADTLDLGVPARFEVQYEDVPNDSVSIYWRMGEGSTYRDRAVVNHTYEELGIFTVRAILTDEDGGETELQYDVEVTPAGPQLVIAPAEPVREGETLSTLVVITPAADGQGGVDGPTSLRVTRAPRGMRWAELAEGPSGEQRFEFVWPTSANDAGLHPLRVSAVAPSGIRREAEAVFEVQEAQDPLLVTLGGRPEQQLISVYRYRYDLSRELTSLEAVARTPVGRGLGRMTRPPESPERLFVSAPTSSQVGVVSLESGEALRLIPVRGAPYALTTLGGYVWAFDARDGRVSAINSKLKVTQSLLIPNLKGVSSASSFVHEGEEVLLAHDHEGQLWVLDPSALLSGQAARAARRVHDLNVSLDVWERAQRGEEPMAGEEGALAVPQRRGAGELSWLPTAGAPQELLLIKHPRGLVAYTPTSLLEANPEPLWGIKSAMYLRSVSLISSEREGEAPALWATSNQGLRRFSLPTEGLVEGSAAEGEVLDLNGYLTLAQGPARLLGEQSVLVGGPRSLTHLSTEGLRALLSAPEPSPQQVMFFTR